MNILKYRRSENKTASVNGRRSFIRKMGAGASAALTTASGLAHAGSTSEQEHGLESLREQETSIRRLHQRFESMLHKGQYSEISALFAEDAEVTFNGGLFSKRDEGINRLFTKVFCSGLTGRRMEPAPGFELDADQYIDEVRISPDMQTASAAFTYSIQVGRPMDAASQLVQMARLHGEGIHKWWEGGQYDVAYIRDETGDWKIGSLAFNTRSQADYRQGRSYASPIVVEPFSGTYPADQQGPDKLV